MREAASPRPAALPGFLAVRRKIAQGIDELAVSSGIIGLKRFQRDLDRQGRIVERQPGDRIAAFVLQRLRPAAAAPRAAVCSTRVTAWPLPVRARTAKKLSGIRGLAQVVEDLPDAQPALAVEPDAAGADAADGHGDRLQVLSAIDAGGVMA